MRRGSLYYYLVWRTPKILNLLCTIRVNNLSQLKAENHTNLVAVGHNSFKRQCIQDKKTPTSACLLFLSLLFPLAWLLSPLMDQL